MLGDELQRTSRVVGWQVAMIESERCKGQRADDSTSAADSGRHATGGVPLHPAAHWVSSCRKRCAPGGRNHESGDSPAGSRAMARRRGLNAARTWRRVGWRASLRHRDRRRPAPRRLTLTLDRAANHRAAPWPRTAPPTHQPVATPCYARPKLRARPRSRPLMCRPGPNCGAGTWAGGHRTCSGWSTVTKVGWVSELMCGVGWRSTFLL
jgi:hypothetical protein